MLKLNLIRDQSLRRDGPFWTLARGKALLRILTYVTGFAVIAAPGVFLLRPQTILILLFIPVISHLLAENLSLRLKLRRRY